MGAGALLASSISLVLLPHMNLGKVSVTPTFPAAHHLIYGRSLGSCEPHELRAGGHRPRQGCGLQKSMWAFDMLMMTFKVQG